MLSAGIQCLETLRHNSSLGRLSQRFRRWGLVCLALMLAALFAGPASAGTVRIRDFHAELDVLPDSSLDVTETIQVDFTGARNGIYRTIPVEYAGPGGFNYSLFLTDISARDSDGSPLRVERQRSAGNLQLKIFVPAAEDTSRNISLHYRVRDGLRFFEDHDELYWNVTGTGWDVPIESASAHVILPGGVTGLRAANFTGLFGSRSADARVDILGSNVDVQTQRPLAFHEGLTIVAGWDKGFVSEPHGSEKIAQFLESNWPLFFPLGVFVLMFWLWYTRGREPRVGAIAVQYEPPAGLSPGEAGALVDDQAGIRDITATLVDLAVRGFIVIEEKEVSHLMGLYSNKEYVFHLNKKPTEWSGAKSHELLLLNGIFGAPIVGVRNDVALSELQNRFYKNLPGIRRAILESLVQHGYFAYRPDIVRQAYILAAAVTGALLYLVGQYLAERTGVQPLSFTVAAILTGLAIAGFGWFMPTRTADGVRALHDTLGFENFLSHVEGDHLARMPQSPANFEKYLPFAMALGVEKKWVGAFDGMLSQPSWYQTTGGAVFHPVGFVYSLDQMTARTGQVMASAPRSSGNSGSSGFGLGGVGGGFGGGGGGGF
ncbi:MAG: hypothetical protein DMG32_23305 [Acidobacteria bacterium]|nr:MAG: hypothetical protein DMG32_23305 [Acidobacteriota bacterium]